MNEDNSSIPLFEIHKSIKTKIKLGYKLKMMKTHQKYKRTSTQQNHNIKM